LAEENRESSTPFREKEKDPLREKRTSGDTKRSITPETKHELINTPNGAGPEVVQLCIERLKSPIFNMRDDNDFMRRVAYVMSDFGREMSGSGGIWQVSMTAFEDTMNTNAHSKLPEKYRKILEAFEIDWTIVTYSDLNKPFYSALAARLYLSNYNEFIPPQQEVHKQAEYWKFKYMKGRGDMSNFKNKVAELK
jgi:hypothetical protein